MPAERPDNTDHQSVLLPVEEAVDQIVHLMNQSEEKVSCDHAAVISLAVNSIACRIAILSQMKASPAIHRYEEDALAGWLKNMGDAGSTINLNVFEIDLQQAQRNKEYERILTTLSDALEKFKQRSKDVPDYRLATGDGEIRKKLKEQE